MRDADQLTGDILKDISRLYPDSLCWRNNTGTGVGWSPAQKAVALIKAHRYQEAITLLRIPLAFGLVGSADILALIRGRFICIEIKIGKDRQTIVQKAFEFQVQRAGGVYLIAHDVKDECMAELQRICPVLPHSLRDVIRDATEGR